MNELVQCIVRYVMQESKLEDGGEGLSDWFRNVDQIEYEREIEHQAQQEYEAARARGETGGL